MTTKANDIVKFCKDNGVERIAISSNGSAKTEKYSALIDAGVNDFSISLDACCSSFSDKMAGVNGYFDVVINNIKFISSKVYCTVGIVLNEENVSQIKDTVAFAHQIGVSDIRIISAAQYNKLLEGVTGIDVDILDKHPILKYRVNNIKMGRNVRGISKTDIHKCFIVVDDSVVAGKYHFPCVIYLREGGEPIGTVGENMRQQRIDWFKSTNTYQNEICRKNCLECIVDHNNKCSMMAKKFLTSNLV